MTGAHAPRHLALRLALLAAALLAGAAFYFFSRPVFSARALVRANADLDGERLRALAKELTQPQLVERTAARLGVKAAASELRATHLFDLAARPAPPRELELEVRAHSRDWAARWTETLAAEFAEFRRIRQRKEMADAIKSLNREMVEIAARLGRPGVKDFHAVDKAGLAGEFDELNEIRSPARELQRVGKQLEELGQVRDGLRNPNFSLVEKLALLAAFEKTAGVESGLGTAWEGLDEKRRAVQALLAAAPEDTLAGDALALALGAQLDELDKKLQAEFDTNYRRFDVDYRNLADRKDALEAKMTQPGGPAEAAIAEQLRHIAKRIETIDSVGKGDGVELAYAGLRDLGDRPVSPNPVKIALGSLLAGGLLALGAPLAGRLARRRPDAAQLGLRELAGLPPLADSPARATAPAAEFRAVPASLPERPRALLLTSALPGEGKTLAAVHLALAFAESGARTLLIDTDLRRGRVHRFFGHRPAPGLAGVLTGDCALDDAIRATHRENLSVLNAGRHPDIPMDLLASDRCAAALKTARENFDIVILDTPPVLGLPATAALLPLVDAVLPVVAVNRTPLHAAQAAVETLRAHGAKLAGFIANRVAKKR